VALRTASRSRLIESLKGIDRPGRIELFDARDHDYALMAATGRQMGIVLFVARCFYGLSEPRGETSRLLILAARRFARVARFGTAVPAARARYGGERYLASMMPWLEVARRAGRPLPAVMRVTDEIVRRLSGARRESPNDSDHAEREILDARSHGEVGGDVDEREKAINRSAMTPEEISAGEIMTPPVSGPSIGFDYNGMNGPRHRNRACH